MFATMQTGRMGLVSSDVGGPFSPSQTGPTLDLVFNGAPGNDPLAASQLQDDSIDLSFTGQTYQVTVPYAVWVDGSGMTQRNFADIVTFTRASAATQFNSTGTLIYAPMNAIRNNMMVGASAPSTFPTNWQNVIVAGLTATVIGTGVENGITYLDVRVNGTPSVSTYYNLVPDILVSGLLGQTWTGSFWASLIAGSLTNTNANIELRESDAAQGFLTNSLTTLSITSTLTRYSQARTLTNASTAFVSVRFVWQVTSGLPVDFTFRIGMPQLELGSTATAVNATSGTAYYGPRFDFNPSTLAAQGLLIEEQRTNSIRNNTMQGAVAGTPGTLPTNWAASTVLTGLTRTIATGTENGIAYIDVRLNGTPSAAGRYDIFYESSTQVAALSGQTWTNSGYFKLQAGTLNGVTAVRLYFEEKNSSGTYLTEQNITITNPTSAALSTQRASGTRTLNQATTAFLLSGFNLLLDGTAIDITLRIGLPQLEQGAFATSVIPTTTTALTRSADVASVNTLSPWYNQTIGTVYAEFAPAFQGSATAAGNNPGVWGATQNSLGSFNGYGVRLFAQSAFSDNINGVSRYSPSGFNTQVNIGPNAFLNLGQTYKTAFAWEASGIAGSRDGQAVVTNTNPAAAAMGTHDQFYLGRQNIGGTPTQLNGYLRRITYYPRRLANADLQTITT